MNLEEHYIIVDHTDNSGLSVHRPTKKDIELFNKYGTLECGNTTHVIPYREYKKLLELLDVAKDSLLFYGQEKNWSTDHDYFNNGYARFNICHGDIEEINNSVGFSGRRAREALREIYSTMKEVCE